MLKDILRHDLEEIYRRDFNWQLFNNKTVLITGAYGMLASYVTLFFIFLHEQKEINVNLILMVRSKEKLEKCIGNKYREFINVCYDSLYDKIKIDGVEIEVIKIGDKVTSAYPTGGGAKALASGFKAITH